MSKEAQEFLNKFTVRLCENQVAYNFLKKINDEHQFRKICSYFNSVSNEQEKLKRLSKGQHETLEDSYLELNDYLEKTKSSIALRQIDLDRTVTNTQEQIKDIAYLDSDVFDLDHVVKNENRVVLLGDAGTGKSVAMEQLFLSFSNSLGHIPILKKLRDYTPTDSLDNFLPKFFKDYEHQELLIILLKVILKEKLQYHVCNAIKQ